VTASPQVRKLQRIRHLLLAALAVAILGVGGLYWFGRAGRDAAKLPADSTADHPGVSVAGEGFDYTLTQGDSKVFRIRGDRIRSDRDDNVELEGVALTFYADGGKEYTLDGRAAVYNRSTHNAHIEGPVKLSGPGGVSLETAALSLDRNGRQLQSNAPVTFQLGSDLRGEARELRAMLPREIFLLVGAVRVSGQGARAGLELEAKRVVFERKDRMLRAEGDVTLRRGASTVTAQRLSAELSEDEKHLNSLQARWEVHAELRPDAAAEAGQLGSATVAGDRLAVLFDPASGSVNRVELVAEDGGVAHLETRGANGEVRRLDAPIVVSDLAAGVLQKAAASGGTRLQSEAADGAKRQASAASAEAFFDPRGSLATVTLAGGVTIVDDRVEARGDRAVLDESAGKAELFGKDAVAKSPRGELLAPHMVWTRANGLVHADGGVRATLQRQAAGALAGTPLGGGDGPVQVEAAEALWLETPPTYSFLGAVRAWRGDNLLVADQLRGNDVEGQLTASGKVSTVWVPEAAAGGAPASPIEVQAPQLVYRRAERYAEYSGGVRIAQEKRLLTCDAAKVTLGEGNRAERVTCDGKVTIDDPPANRKVEGQHADYDVAAKTITVTGEPVTLSDLVRGKAQGKQLIYDLAQGTIRLLSAAEAPPGGAEGR
jgi:LPS export ABC transporter protein LptC/lipopolysaccharide transport protein LptA